MMTAFVIWLWVVMITAFMWFRMTPEQKRKPTVGQGVFMAISLAPLAFLGIILLWLFMLWVKYVGWYPKVISQ